MVRDAGKVGLIIQRNSMESLYDIKFVFLLGVSLFGFCCLLETLCHVFLTPDDVVYDE